MRMVATPEPSTWAMMLTGLIMIGLVARKKRRGSYDRV
jgi:archaellum biogenesis protein FlaJ (TadC family)